MGNAATTEIRRATCDEHPQHVIAALARLAQIRKPMLGPAQ